MNGTDNNNVKSNFILSFFQSFKIGYNGQNYTEYKPIWFIFYYAPYSKYKKSRGLIINGIGYTIN
tara:strand:+ start:3072 stop:3266 length:195 start_codon:yes stop_codon:yes gene_type:complete